MIVSIFHQENASGQLGIDSTAAVGSAPSSMLSARYVVFNAVQNTIAVIEIGISSGANHSCALFADGTIICWGYNNFGQLGCDSPIGTNAGDDVGEMDTLGTVSFNVPHKAVQVVAAALSTCGIVFFFTYRMLISLHFPTLIYSF